MSKKEKSRWNKLTPTQVGQAFFDSIQGDCSRLADSFKPTDSVWGLIGQKLGKDFKTTLDRFWLKNAFTHNKKGIRDIHYNICTATNTVYIPPPEDQNRSNSNREYYCYCKHLEANASNVSVSTDMIQCDTCAKWFHGLCVKVVPKRFPENREYICPFCKDPKNKDDIPKLFRSILESYEDINLTPTTSTPNKPIQHRSPEISPFSPTPKSKHSRSESDSSGSLKHPRKIRKNVVKNKTIENDANSTTEIIREKESSEKDDDSEEPAFGDVTLHRMEGTDGPVSEHKIFTFVISKDDWLKITPQPNPANKQRGYRYHMPRAEWGNVLQAGMKASKNCSEEIKGCVLVCDKHRVYEDQDVNPQLNYITAYMFCKRQDCKMKFTFRLENVPLTNTRVTWEVEPKGCLQHDLNDPSKRWLQGTQRDKAKQHFRTTPDKPATYRRKLFVSEEINKTARDKNDFTEVQTNIVLSRVKKQVLAEQDLDKDIIIDLCKRKQAMQQLDHLKKNDAKKNTPEGYIQEISLDPFFVVLYTWRQLDILRKLLRVRPQSYLFFDATGTIVTKLPDYIRQKRLYYYAICIHVPDSDSAPVPITEIISNSHDGNTIGTALGYFVSRYRDFTGSKDPTCGIRFIQTDNSLALMAGIQRAFGFGTLAQYLDLVWKHLINREPLHLVHHVCRAHVTKFISDKIKDVYKETERSVMHLWKKYFLFEKDMWGTTRRIKDGLLLSGKKYLSSEVRDVIAQINAPTSNTVGAEGYPWNIVNTDKLSDKESFYSRSPFGNLALKLSHQIGVKLPDRIKYRHGRNISFDDWDEMDLESSHGAMNPYFNEDFLVYLIITILPISPLLNHSLIYLNNATLQNDTNSIVECWNKIIKVDEHPNLPQRITRFIINEEEVLRGRLEIFDTAVTSIERQTYRLGKVGTQTSTQSNIRSPRSSQDTADESETEGGSKSDDEDSPEDIQHQDKENLKITSRVSPKPVGRLQAPIQNVSRRSQKKQIAPDSQIFEDLVPETSEESWNKKKTIKFNAKKQRSGSVIQGINRIPYGGIVDTLVGFRNVYNTCNLDSQLQVMYCLFKLHASSNSYITDLAKRKVHFAPNLIRVFSFLDASQFNKAREETMFGILKLSPELSSTYNLFDSEDRFLKAIHFFSRCYQSIKCGNKNCHIAGDNIEMHIATDFFIQNPTDFNKYNIEQTQTRCLAGCQTSSKTSYTWPEAGPPPFVAVPFGVRGSEPAKIEHFLTNQEILGKMFTVFAFTFFKNDHFKAVIKYNKQFYIYDGLRADRFYDFEMPEENSVFTTAWYVLMK